MDTWEGGIWGRGPDMGTWGRGPTVDTGIRGPVGVPMSGVRVGYDPVRDVGILGPRGPRFG